MNSVYFVGVDLGQVQDYTAIAVMERTEENGGRDHVMFAWRKVVKLQLRFLERMPRGTPYTEVTKRVAAVTRAPELASRCQVAVDATGVGRPVVDMLKQEVLLGQLVPVLITGGDLETTDQGFRRVPKRDLIVGLQVLLQREALEIAGGLPYGEELLGEMAAMRVKVTTGGHEQYGAWREGTHDDLVFAVALAAWAAKKAYPKEPAGEEAYWRVCPELVPPQKTAEERAYWESPYRVGESLATGRPERGKW